MNQLDSTTDRFDTLARQWHDDRDAQQAVRASDAWRGCIGLAAMLHPGTRPTRLGKRLLVPNDAVQWIGLRDIPGGHWRSGSLVSMRPRRYVTTARADLVYGMPRIPLANAARHAVDFGVMPTCPAEERSNEAYASDLCAGGEALDGHDDPRMFDVLNQLSRQMTAFALRAVDDSNTPVRPPWFAHRPHSAPPMPIIPPSVWMPVPYMSFSTTQLDSLYASVFATGSSQASHSVSPVVAAQFNRALLGGLPLHVWASMRYLGTVAGASAKTHSDPVLLTHAFQDKGTGRTHRFHLPRQAQILVLPGDELEPGQCWCIVLPELLERTRQQSDARPVGSLHHLIDPRMLPRCQNLWFADQGLGLPDQSDRLHFPAFLVSRAVNEVRPCSLSWDLSPSARRGPASGRPATQRRGNNRLLIRERASPATLWPPPTLRRRGLVCNWAARTG